VLFRSIAGVTVTQLEEAATQLETYVSQRFVHALLRQQYCHRNDTVVVRHQDRHRDDTALVRQQYCHRNDTVVVRHQDRHRDDTALVRHQDCHRDDTALVRQQYCHRDDIGTTTLLSS